VVVDGKDQEMSARRDGITLTSSTIADNALQGIMLTFRTRADVRSLVVDTYSCDATVLVRGTSIAVCPH
jgi:hypothetical protein